MRITRDTPTHAAVSALAGLELADLGARQAAPLPRPVVRPPAGAPAPPTT
jgi:hypothetical protein